MPVRSVNVAATSRLYFVRLGDERASLATRSGDVQRSPLENNFNGSDDGVSGCAK